MERLGLLLIAGTCLFGLSVGAGLEPSVEGHGTHMQLGMAPCGWVVAFGRPCPTCGMTTAVAHATRGDFLNSLITQPAGAAFALGLGCLFWIGLHAALTGSHLARHLGRLVLRPRAVWAGVLGLGLAWAYKFLTW